jgi:dTDP-4-dehydrorhamnose 3,5-epimerase
VKITDIYELAIPAVKVIRFARFSDDRGYFSEHYRFSDFESGAAASFMNGVRFLQANESFSRPGTVRGLHFQWNPFMGKLVRTVRGHMIDVVLDVRKGSPTYGKIIAHDMPVHGDEPYSEWIWVPPGFAHGNTFTEETVIEYYCSGEYSPGNEAGISPIANDLDWSLCEPGLADQFRSIASETPLMTDKDRNALTVAGWTADPRSDVFLYDELS